MFFSSHGRPFALAARHLPDSSRFTEWDTAMRLDCALLLVVVNVSSVEDDVSLLPFLALST